LINSCLGFGISRESDFHIDESQFCVRLGLDVPSKEMDR
jgi:hypothetical protein